MRPSARNFCAPHGACNCGSSSNSLRVNSCALEVELASTAVANGDPKALAEALDRAISPAHIVNSLTSAGQTVLGLAVSSGDPVLVRLCLGVTSCLEEVEDQRPRTARSLPSSPSTVALTREKSESMRTEGHLEVIRCDKHSDSLLSFTATATGQQPIWKWSGQFCRFSFNNGQQRGHSCSSKASESNVFIENSGPISSRLSGNVPESIRYPDSDFSIARTKFSRASRCKSS